MYGNTFFNTSELPKEVWVEIVTPSSQLRDVVITAYCGVEPRAADTVNATGVWATQTAVEYANADYDDLVAQETWAPVDTTTPPKGEAHPLGGTGLRPILETGFVANGIWMRYTVGPAGIQNVGTVKWDITRRMTTKAWWLDQNRNQTNDYENAPTPHNEEANDDELTDPEESSEPNADGHMFVVDGPGIDQVGPGVYSRHWYWIARFNAEEFVRVSFDGQSPEGIGVKGTRASDKFLWHARHDLERDRGGALWKRTTGDEEPVHHVNCVGTENPPLGGSP